MNLEFRTLNADEIDCRVATVNEKGVSLLLYKDARCDMNILDETVGAENWQRNHELINGNLFCNVSIKCEDTWVTKQDVGTESYTEKEKGQASDSFKRACFNWGLGRELYTAPFIWISAKDAKVTESEYQGKKKYTTYERFKVDKIAYQNKKITGLIISNVKSNKVVFSYGMTVDKDLNPISAEDIASSKIGQAKINIIKKELERTGVSEKAICERYSVGSVKDITEKIFTNVFSDLKATKSKEGEQ